MAQPKVRGAELAGEKELFQRGMRGSEHAQLFAFQAGTDEVERLLPVDLFPLAAFADERSLQPVGRVEPLIGKAVLVREPALVDRLVLERQHAHHAVLLHLHHEVGAEGVVRRNRFAARELPGARGIAERLRGERAHRADVDHVARELGLHGAADEGDDLGVLAAAG